MGRLSTAAKPQRRDADTKLAQSRLIPIPIDQDACAQSRRPMEMIFQG